MKSYIEIKVPVSFDEPWFDELRSLMEGVNVTWQRGHYHITMAFLDNSPRRVNLIPGLDAILGEALAPVITFDKLDAFTTRGDQSHVVHLTTTEVPADFSALVNAIRNHLKAKGCAMQSAFRLHVTLGRVKDRNVSLEALHDIIGRIDLPAATLDLTQVEYLTYPDHRTLGKWTLPTGD